LHKYLEKITVRAGSLVIWRGEMAHCNYPNASNKFRMVQYLKMFPQRSGYPGLKQREELVKNLLPKEVNPTELGRKLFGIEEWNKN
jgi:ectoine hydroxylase-related dioxygenase (phytanoyl-CoA dioxygenase family)